MRGGVFRLRLAMKKIPPSNFAERSSPLSRVQNLVPSASVAHAEENVGSESTALGSGLRFMINKRSAVPLHIQIKEQIRYAVLCGDLRPGELLPSIRELTANLRVHRNTVHRVYLELQAVGLLVSIPGKGVFVNESLRETTSIGDLNAVNQLVEHFFHQANAIGLDPGTLTRLMTQKAPDFDTRYPIVVFVECTAHSSQEMAKSLATHLGLQVQHLLLDTLREDPQILGDTLRHVITSAFHYDEVSELLKHQKRRVHAVAYQLHNATRARLRKVISTQRVGFICQDANTEEIVAREILTQIPADTLKGCDNLETPRGLTTLLKKVDLVLFTLPATEFCMRNASPRHELLELHYAFHSTSLRQLTHTLFLQPQQ